MNLYPDGNFKGWFEKRDPTPVCGFGDENGGGPGFSIGHKGYTWVR